MIEQDKCIHPAKGHDLHLSIHSSNLVCLAGGKDTFFLGTSRQHFRFARAYTRMKGRKHLSESSRLTLVEASQWQWIYEN